jgi:hypothetical protein
MTIAAIGSPGLRTIGRLGRWLSVRHSLRVEAAGALTVYGAARKASRSSAPHCCSRADFALVGFLVYPTAPPRLAGVDTVSGRQVDLNRGLGSALYNPYALILAAGLVRHGRRLSSARSGRSTRRSWCSSSSPPATISSSTPPRTRVSPGSRRS